MLLSRPPDIQRERRSEDLFVVPPPSGSTSGETIAFVPGRDSPPHRYWCGRDAREWLIQCTEHSVHRTVYSGTSAGLPYLPY